LVIRPAVPVIRLQSIFVAALLLLCVYTLTNLTDLLSMPADQWRQVVGTPGAWTPLVMLSVLLGAAIYLEWRAKPVNTGAWIVLSLMTLLVVPWFFRGGRIDWQASLDWRKEWTYYDAVKQSFAAGRLPWHLTSAFQHTNKFFSNPETVIAPHLVALAVLPIPAFVLVQFVGVMSAGLIALRSLLRDLQFGPVAALAFTAIFVLNGHVLHHLGGGHLQWISCFLFPAVFLFVHRFAAGNTSPRTHAGLAAALASLLTLGGWHMFVWAILFTSAFFAVDPRRWRPGLVVASLTIGLGAYRILPAAIAHEGFRFEFLASYPNLKTLVGAFIGEPQPFDGRVLWIEYDAYLGWIGLLLFCLGLTAPLSKSWRRPIGTFWLPALIVLALACGPLYRWTLFQLPAFGSERVASRFVIISLLGFGLIGCAQLNGWLRERRGLPLKLAVVAAAGWLMAAQLMVRADQRRPGADRGEGAPVVSAVDPTPPSTADILGLSIGVAISLGSAVAAARMWRRPELDGTQAAA
jgi:hypothetical protein